MPALSRAYRFLIDAMAVIAGGMLVWLMVSVVVSVAMRNAGLQPFAWLFTSAEYGMLYMTMLGAPWLVRERGHVHIELLTSALPAGVQRVVSRTVAALCVAICAYLAWKGTDLVSHQHRAQRLRRAGLLLPALAPHHLASSQLRAHGDRVCTVRLRARAASHRRGGNPRMMEWYEALALLLGAILVFMGIGMPVAIAFLAANVIGALVFMGGERGVVQLLNNGWASLATFGLVPIPLFLLMGEVFFHTGLGSRMFNAIDRLLGRLPGRLSYVTVLGGTGFATLSGSSMGSTALLGSLMVPEMNKRGYKTHMSVGPILGTGGLAIIIPPRRSRCCSPRSPRSTWARSSSRACCRGSFSPPSTSRRSGSRPASTPTRRPPTRSSRSRCRGSSGSSFAMSCRWWAHGRDRRDDDLGDRDAVRGGGLRGARRHHPRRALPLPDARPR
jgi:hypothetical protein